MKNSKKIFTPLMVMMGLVILMATLSMSSPVYAQTTGSNQGGNSFMTFIHTVLRSLGLEKASDNSPQTNPNSQVMQPDTANVTPNGATGSGQLRMRGDGNQMEETRLTTLVDEGKITEAQKAAIVAELTAVREKYMTGAGTSTSQTDRQANITKMQDELKAWAKAQGIDSSYLTFGPSGRPSGTSGKGENFRSDDDDKGPLPVDTQ